MAVDSHRKAITLIGLGAIGSGMASRLLDAGLSLSIYTRDLRKGIPFEERGAKLFTDLPSVAATSDIIFSIVSDDKASKAIWFGQNGILSHARKNAILVETSTLSFKWVSELAVKAQLLGLAFLDAPVTGSKIQAQEGALRFLVGGSPPSLATIEPVLKILGKEVVYLGPAGSGTKMKLINNFLTAVQIAATAEAVVLAEATGLDIVKAQALLETGAPGSPIVKTMLGRMIARDFTQHFSPALMAKDLQYAIELARTVGLNIDSASAALALFDSAVGHGFTTSDVSSVVEPIRKHQTARG